MRSWWKQTFGIDISVLEMLSMRSIAALGKHAAEGLKLKFEEEQCDTNKGKQMEAYLAMKAP
jgi:hypothetical protein